MSGQFYPPSIDRRSIDRIVTEKLMSQFYLPSISRINKILVIAIVGVFIFQTLFMLGGLSLPHIFGLSAAKFFSGHIYQLAFFPFLGSGLLATIFNGLILWFFGSELEYRWGLYRYCQFIAASLGGQALVYLTIMLLFFNDSLFYNNPLVGMGGFCTTLCMAYGILFPNRVMYLYLFPVKAKWFVAIIIFISLYQALPSQGGIYAWAQLAAMAAGFSWMIFVSPEKPKSGNRQKQKKSPLRMVKGFSKDPRNKDDDEIYH